VYLFSERFVKLTVIRIFAGQVPRHHVVAEESVFAENVNVIQFYIRQPRSTVASSVNVMTILVHTLVEASVEVKFLPNTNNIFHFWLKKGTFYTKNSTIV